MSPTGVKIKEFDSPGTLRRIGMKTYLIRNPQSTYGYQLKIIDDDGHESILDPIGKDPNTKNGLKLPDNPSNRRWISPKPGVDEQEIPYKETRHFGPRKETQDKTQTSTSKGWISFLTDDEMKVLEELKSKAMARKQISDIKSKIAELKKLLPEEDE